MLQNKTLISSWGIGLSEEQATLLRATLGEDHELILYTDAAHIAENASKRTAPYVVWLSAAASRDLNGLPQALARHGETAAIALLLDQNYSLEDFERACDYGIAEILRPPLTREQIAEVMRRALEVRAVHDDIDCMTREIMLERELLERKNEILSFLVNFLTGTTENLDLEHLLLTAYKGITVLLPARAMNVVLWDRDPDGLASLSLYTSASPGTEAHAAWRELLLEQARLSLGKRCSVTEESCLPLHGKIYAASGEMPSEGTLLCLPLICDSKSLGMLLLLLDTDKHLGRDQALALDSALRHLALSIKNARQFKKMQQYADYDGLTRVHSRRHFEHRMDEEMQRFARYGQPLSVLMLDIDHFKHINDKYGHHVGDAVLRDVALRISDCIRSTDYCARYGGEEFVVLLPYTGSKKAANLAERIRNAIATHPCLAPGGDPICMTISIGVAHLSRTQPKDKLTLICEADAALYAAKAEGRNRTCSAPAPLLSLHQGVV